MPIFFPSVFVSALNFPQFTFGAAAFNFGLRVSYTNAYFSHRGHNRAQALEELLKFTLLVLIMSSFASSFKIMGINRQSL